MKIFRLISLAALAGGMLSPAFAKKPIHVIIDAGHGGRDYGAARGEVRESDITLKIAQALHRILERDPQFTVNLTRKNDHYLKLSERAQIAREENGQIFISLHANFSTDPRAAGAEFYFQNVLPADQESMVTAARENQEETSDHTLDWPLKPISQARYAKPEVKAILKDLQSNHRAQLSAELTKSLVRTWQGHRKSTRHTIHQAPFFVINNVNMPSALVEVGFLSNKREVRDLVNPTFHQRIAQGLYDGIKAFNARLEENEKNE